MIRARLVALVVGAVVAIGLALVWPVPSEQSNPPALRVVSAPVLANPQVAQSGEPFASPPSPPSTPLANARTRGSPLAAELNAPAFDAQHDVVILHEMLRQYLRLLRGRQGHPIGNDTDLARVLTGHNPMKLVILPPRHGALSPDGRLRDRWGTPYFIHPRGRLAFEVRSAGPDRRLFTADDLIENPAPRETDTRALSAIEQADEP